MRDHDAFWLIDGKAEAPKKEAPKVADGLTSPLAFSVAERVDDHYDEIGLYVSTCGHCGEQSPPICQDLLQQWRQAHVVQHGGAA